MADDVILCDKNGKIYADIYSTDHPLTYTSTRLLWAPLTLNFDSIDVQQYI